MRKDLPPARLAEAWQISLLNSVDKVPVRAVVRKVLPIWLWPPSTRLGEAWPAKESASRKFLLASVYGGPAWAVMPKTSWVGWALLGGTPCWPSLKGAGKICPWAEVFFGWQGAGESAVGGSWWLRRLLMAAELL